MGLKDARNGLFLDLDGGCKGISALLFESLLNYTFIVSTLFCILDFNKSFLRNILKNLVVQ